MWKSLKVFLCRIFRSTELSEGRFGWKMTDVCAAPPSAKRQCTDEQENGRNAESTLAESLAETAEEKTPFQRIKRKKCALLISYNGKGYLGMQLNPGTKTIERDLLDALAKAEAYPEDMKNDTGKLQFQRCSRTDKGVSAVRQVVSIKMAPQPSIAELANKYLPPQIRVMGFRKVTRMFNSKMACTARTYEYLLPTYAFAPYIWTTLDYRIDDSTLEKVKRLLKMYENNHNFHNFTSGKKFEEQSANRYIMSFTCGTPFLTTVSSSPSNHSQQTLLPNIIKCVEHETKPHHSREDMITHHTISNDNIPEEPRGDIQIDSSTIATDRTIIESAAIATDRPSETVAIATDVTSEVVAVATDEKSTAEERVVKCSEDRKREVEFVTLQVKGQSFMIHQIRKMIGLVIAIVRGFTPETTLIESFGQKKVDIPKAPALGLLLENVFFDGYNKRYKSDSTHAILDWTECNERVETFKREHIYKNIIETEIEDMSMMQWLGSLQIHEFYQTRQRIADAQKLKTDLEQKEAKTVEIPNIMTDLEMDNQSTDCANH